MNTGDIDDKLTHDSREFINEWTSMRPVNIDAVLQIGEKYAIKDLLFSSFLNYKKELQRNNASETFYTILGLEQVPLFNFYAAYEVDKKRTRINPDVYVAIISGEGEQYFYLNWVRLVRENDELKYDLLYTLQLSNRLAQEINDSMFRASELDSRGGFYRKISEGNEGSFYDRAFIEEQVARRKSMLEK